MIDIEALIREVVLTLIRRGVAGLEWMKKEGLIVDFKIADGCLEVDLPNSQEINVDMKWRELP